MKHFKTTLKWIAMIAVVLTVIIVPFILFGEEIEQQTDTFLHTASEHRLLTAGVLGGLLATDILLPIPSSIVSSASGFFLGLFAGTLTSLVGMTISCLAGYGLGLFGGRQLGTRMLGSQELQKLEKLNERFGDWMVVISRPVPVLAEAAVFFAGMGKMSFRRFFLMSTTANLAVSLVYAIVGAYSATVHSFLFALGGSICLPGLMMLFFKSKRNEGQRS